MINKLQIPYFVKSHNSGSDDGLWILQLTAGFTNSYQFWPNKWKIWTNNSDKLKKGSRFPLIDYNLKVIAVKFAIPFAFF